MKLATKVGQTLTKVTRDKAAALIGDSLRNVRKDGSADDEALGAVVDDLEQAGFALFEIGDQPE